MYDSRIKLRVARQRYDKGLIPMFCTVQDGQLLNEDLEPIGTAKKVGEFMGWDGFGIKARYEAFEVHINGWLVPAYRTKAKEGDDGEYVICQRYSYKAVKE